MRKYIRYFISIIIAFIFLELVGKRINLTLLRLFLTLMICIIMNALMDFLLKKTGNKNE